MPINTSKNGAPIKITPSIFSKNYLFFTYPQMEHFQSQVAVY